MKWYRRLSAVKVPLCSNHCFDNLTLLVNGIRAFSDQHHGHLWRQISWWPLHIYRWELFAGLNLTHSHHYLRISLRFRSSPQWPNSLLLCLQHHNSSWIFVGSLGRWQARCEALCRGRSCQVLCRQCRSVSCLTSVGHVFQSCGASESSKWSDICGWSQQEGWNLRPPVEQRKLHRGERRYLCCCYIWMLLLQVYAERFNNPPSRGAHSEFRYSLFSELEMLNWLRWVGNVMFCRGHTNTGTDEPIHDIRQVVTRRWNRRFALSPCQLYL